MTPQGLTGQQVVKWIPADRIYVKSVDPTLDAPTVSYNTKSNGSTPTGWTDLGTLDDNVKVTYDQNVEKVTTGPDEYLRGAYLKSKGGTIDFSLSQVDDVALSIISGLTPSVIVPGSIVTFEIGSTDMSQLAILVVSQDKLTQKEYQFYNPNAFLTFQYDMSKDAMVLKCQGFLPYFTPVGATKESIFHLTEFV